MARQQISSPTAPRPLSPDPSGKIEEVVLKSATNFPLLYRKRIDSVSPQAKAGDWVAVYGPQQELLGYGLYNPRSEIRVRMVRFGQGLPDDAFWEERLALAVALRRDLLRLDEVTDSYRVIHAEADGFPGLVVDRLGDVLSAEVFSLGMYQRAEALLAKLAAQLGTRHTLIRGNPAFLSQEGYDPPQISSPELPKQITIREFGTRFRVRFEGSHKTGFFCDQRDNRRQVASFCAGKSVLDMCCYTGGFAIQAKKLGNAEEVIGVDLDEEPLEVARENANLNQVRVKFVQADAFSYMRDMLRAGKRYDVVVLDPPKIVRSREERETGTRKLYDLNRLAAQLVRSGGMLFTCCCAGLVSGEEFARLATSAVRQPMPPGVVSETAGDASTIRTVQTIDVSGASGDHPVSPLVPETEYLHGLWFRVV